MEITYYPDGNMVVPRYGTNADFSDWEDKCFSHLPSYSTWIVPGTLEY